MILPKIISMPLFEVSFSGGGRGKRHSITGGDNLAQTTKNAFQKLGVHTSGRRSSTHDDRRGGKQSLKRGGQILITKRNPTQATMQLWRRGTELRKLNSRGAPGIQGRMEEKKGGR